MNGEGTGICDQIKEQVSLCEEMEKHGLTLHGSGTSRMKTVCPFHSDNDPSLVVNLNSDHEWFYCFGCQASGSVIDFIMKFLDTDMKGAIQYFKDNYSIADCQEIDLEHLVSETKHKRERIFIPPQAYSISRLVRGLLKASTNRSKALAQLSPYLSDFDLVLGRMLSGSRPHAARLTDREIVIFLSKHLRKEIGRLELS